MPAASASRAPRPRLGLRPGAPVLRRDAHTLQVGLDAPARALLDDSAAVRALLADLAAGRWRADATGPQAPTGEVRAALQRLEQARLLVPAVRSATVPGAPDPARIGALAAWAGGDAGRRLEARAAMQVRVCGAAPWRAPLERLLAESGVPTGEPGHPGTDPAPSLVVVVGDGELPRTDVDPWVQQGVPHLLVWSRGGLPRVGPFVVVGLTACLRCVDAHDSESDPRRPLLLEQAAQARSVGADPVLATLAAGYAARDVLRYAEGEVPTSWSATVTLAPHGPPAVRTWLRHPHCGCAWDADLYAAG